MKNEKIKMYCLQLIQALVKALQRDHLCRLKTIMDLGFEPGGTPTVTFVHVETMSIVHVRTTLSSTLT